MLTNRRICLVARRSHADLTIVSAQKSSSSRVANELPGFCELRLVAFRHVDVFTQRAFTGNPLMVVLNAANLSDSEMQMIAREFEMPETTFVLPAEKTGVDYKLRIFTPLKEIPFAGHPIVGTAHVVVTEDLVTTQRPRDIISHETGVGILPIEVIYENESVPRILMTQGEPRLMSVLNDEQVSSVAAALQIGKKDVKDGGCLPQIVSTGLPQLFVHVKDLDTIAKISPDLSRVRIIEGKLGLTGVGVFTMQTVSSEASAHLRFFAPSIGIAEDAAAGSAAGGLGVYLAAWNLLQREKLSDFCIEQGIEMGRPSKLYVSVQLQDGSPTAAKVGGYSITVASGTLSLP